MLDWMETSVDQTATFDQGMPVHVFIENNEYLK